jgi:hypothetical protein
VERKKVYRDADGVRRTVILDDSTPNVFGVLTEQVVDEILDGIARDREIMPMNGVNKVIARIPITVYERACHEHWDENDWRKFLNSDECAPFRIWRGRI